MTEPLGAAPADLRLTARYLAMVSDDMKDVQTSLHDLLTAEGQAWGDDKIGNRFADSQKGYLSQLNWVEGSIAAKTDLLDYYSGALKIAADALEQQDSA